MLYEPQPAPDVVFLRKTGIALLALTVAVGAITIFGSLKANDTLVMAQSVDVGTSATGLILKQIERNISLREMLQAQYVNPRITVTLHSTEKNGARQHAQQPAFTRDLTVDCGLTCESRYDSTNDVE